MGRSSFDHNADCWPGKIAANMARDAEPTARLKHAGWTVLRLWEHENVADVVEDIGITVVGGTRRSYTSPEK